MAKYIRPTHLEKKKVIRHFAMTWSSSAHIENVSIRKTNNGMRIASMGCNGVILTRNVLPYRLPPPPPPPPPPAPPPRLGRACGSTDPCMHIHGGLMVNPIYIYV